MTVKAKKSDPMTPAEVKDLFEKLEPYEAEVELAEARLAIKGKSYAEAQKDQVAWSTHYDARRSELATLVKRMEARVYAIRGRLHRFMKEHDAHSSSERQIEKYIDCNEEFLTANDVFLHVDELYKKYTAINEGFTRRGFALRDLTTARVNEFQNETI